MVLSNKKGRNAMTSVSDKILKRVRGKGRGWVFTPKDFIDFGTRASIDMAMSRLAQSGAIRRIGRGLYDYPKQHAKLGTLSPDADSVVQAVSAQTGDKVFWSAAVAINRLGLSTQVPAKTTYVTDGPTRTKKVAGRTITLKHTRTPLLDNASSQVDSVLQALSLIGKGNVDSNLINTLAKRLDDRDIKALLKARAKMPGWMGDIVLKMGTQYHG